MTLETDIEEALALHGADLLEVRSTHIRNKRVLKARYAVAKICLDHGMTYREAADFLFCDHKVIWRVHPNYKSGNSPEGFINKCGYVVPYDRLKEYRALARRRTILLKTVEDISIFMGLEKTNRERAWK